MSDVAPDKSHFEAFEEGVREGRLQSVEKAVEAIPKLWEVISKLQVSVARIWVYVTIAAGTAAFIGSSLAERIIHKGTP